MSSIFHRLFGVGRMPGDVLAEIAGEDVRFRTEGVRVTLRRSGRVPGVRVTGGVVVWLGAFAVTDRRVVGTRGKAKLVDVPYDAATPDGPATLTLDETGLHVSWDLDRVHPSCHGRMRLDFRAPLTAGQLAAFPIREITFPVDPQKVVRLFGSLRKLPA